MLNFLCAKQKDEASWLQFASDSGKYIGECLVLMTVQLWGRLLLNLADQQLHD